MSLLRSKSPLPAALAAGMLAACISAPQGTVNRYSGGEGSRSTQTIEGDKLFAANIEIQNIVRTRRNDLLLVQFDLVNRNASPIGFQWTVDWFDTQGIKVPDATQHWEPVRLAGRAAQTVSIVAPHASATQWQLQVGSRDEVQ